MRSAILIVAVVVSVAPQSVLACDPTPAGGAAVVDRAETAITLAKKAWAAQSPPFSADYIKKLEPYHAVLEGEAWRVDP